ncbi:LuxR C-terminal-related transcriptional regulator [Sporichthya brevicatena]|uniref:LuxR C-terminal-related transcriptional regulator n=1 Tax=Sporichthya brevicatena TaxID=171442 RepID=A0ABN1GSR1_9ACTN
MNRLRGLAEFLDEDLPISPSGHDVDAVSDAAAELGERCLARLAAAGIPDPSLAATLADLQELYAQLRRQELADRHLRLAECERGLARLRGAPYTADLLDQAGAEVARSCGLQRVVLSRVEEGAWTPWIVHADAGDPWWTLNGRVLELRSGSGPEGRVVAERRAVLAGERAWADADWPDGPPYVVAPIAPAGTVIGLLHGDHGPDGPACDATDRDVLSRFAQGFGHLYERTALLESMRFQQQQLRDLLAVLNATTEQLTESAIELTAALGADPVPPIPPAAAVLDDRLAALTGRERQVLELVARGARNVEIAERLVMSEGTVKVHVKHILAKLGASNRSQAIALYLGRQSPAM